MTRKYGLIGENINHSLSPLIHREIFEKLELDGDYGIFQLNGEGLENALNRLFKQENLKGINVTIPYKIKTIPYLNRLSQEAEGIGAINTIALDKDKLIGFNTDYYGFAAMLEKNDISVQDKTVVILGTGGVSKAVFLYLKNAGAKNIFFVSRTPDENSFSYDRLMDLKGDIIINCTPCGMHPNISVSPIPSEVLKNFDTAVDLIYKPNETLFLKQAEENGLKTTNGLYMLVAQAVASQEIWNNIRFKRTDIDDIYISLRKIINNNKKNLVLIGMPGSGKTTIGKLLASRLDKDFIDIDKYIERQQGCTIKDIFQQGEDAFRYLENRAVTDMEDKENFVITTGGGVIKNFLNIKSLRKNGIIIYINRSVENIIKNIDISTRPLLASGKNSLNKLYDERRELYERYSDFTIDNNRNIKNTVECIVDMLKERGTVQ